MASTLLTSHNATITLGRKIGSGGEGEVFELQGQPDLVAKLYHEPLAAERAEKLQVLARLGNERLFKLAAWPVDVVRATLDGQACGFLMRKISQAAEVHTLHSPKSRLQKFPEASWAFLIYVAANIARAVAAIHEHGFVIGDVNPKNILVTRRATVYLLDCDSFQVTAESKTYRCAGGFPEYTPPELQGVIFREVDRQPEHDWFGLGVVIFQLLFLGRHPFSGRFTGAGELPLERAIKELRFAYGADAITREMQPPPGTLALEAVPEPLCTLFRAAFLSDSAASRPRPSDWIAPLETLSQSLTQCALHSGHRYWRDLTACPWCAIEARARIRLFNFALNGKARQQGYFQLDEVWREIESVTPPEAPPLPGSRALALVPSAEAEDIVRRRRNSYYLAILLSLVSGFAIGMWVGFPFALFLLVVAYIAAWQVAGAKLDTSGSVQTFWQSLQAVADDPLIERFVGAKQQAEAEVGQLVERWRSEASAERFREQLRELQTWKATYESLSFQRTQRLKRMEEEARVAQLNHFLRQFELDKAELKNIGPVVSSYLHNSGVKTAADVSAQRLKNVLHMGDARAWTLLNWRSELERQFVFEPDKAVSPRARLKLEIELDDQRKRLEHDLRHGASYLNRIKDELAKNQQALHAPLLTAQTALAQAEKDYAAVAKRNPVAPLVVCLIFAFFWGMIGQANRVDERRWAEAFAPQAPPPLAITVPDRRYLGQREIALRLYEKGKAQMERWQFEAAVNYFQQAVAADPTLALAHQELGYAFYQLNKYNEAIEAWQKAVGLFHSFPAFYGLGLAYSTQRNWPAAFTAFQNAVGVAGGATMYGPSYWQAHYKLAFTLVKLQQAKEMTENLKKSLAQNPGLVEERFLLSALYELTGRSKEAQTQYKILLRHDSHAANELWKLLPHAQE
jgi:DNA-binding helix-hairpin-helix protein with protein kinase domain